MFISMFLILMSALVGTAYMDRIALGSKIEKYNYTKLKASAKKEDALKSAIVRYIIDKNTEPTMQNLIDNGYLASIDTDNNFGNTYSFVIDRSKATIDISTTFATATQKDIYLKLYTRTFKGTSIGNTVTTKHLIPTDFLNNIDISDSFRTAVQDAAPDASAYTFWIDTSSEPAVRKVSNGTDWKIYELSIRGVAAVSTTNTEASADDLPTNGASVGDIKYVYNSTKGTINEYVYYNNSWIKKVNASCSPSSEKKCPVGFVYIPGSINLEGAAKGWCVAKYEMSPFNISGWYFNGNFRVYEYKKEYENDNWKNITSKPGRYPIGYVSSNNARAACANRLSDYNGKVLRGGSPMRYQVHKALIKDLSLNSENWSSGVVGSGYIYTGNNDGLQVVEGGDNSHALAASSDDTQGYIGTGNVEGDQKRTLKLSNGQTLWDIGGNLWEQMYEGHNFFPADCRAHGWGDYRSGEVFSPSVITESLKNWNNIVNKIGRRHCYGNLVQDSPRYGLFVGGYFQSRALGNSTGIFSSWWDHQQPSHRDPSRGVRCIVPAQ